MMKGSEEQPEPKHKDPDENQLLDPYSELHKTQEKIIFSPMSSLQRTPPGQDPHAIATPPRPNSQCFTRPEPSATPFAPIFTSSTKRKEVSPLTSSTDKRTKLELASITKLKLELSKLSGLVAGMKAKNCIKSSVIKLSALSDLVEKDIENQLEPAQLEAALLSLQPNVDIDSRHIVTREMSTQTPPSIPNEFAGEEIRDLFSDPDKHGELLEREWPKAAFLRTTMTRGGLFKMLPGTARAVLATASTLKSNEFLCRLGLSHPILKSLDENSLPPGKTATIKCGVEMTIDGQWRR